MKYQPQYLLPSIVFLIILIPHLIWLMNNDYITLTYGIHRTGVNEPSITDHFKYPIIFVGKQIGILIPFILLTLLLVKKVKYKINFNDKKLLFLIFINILPIILIFKPNLLMKHY